ncbi:MAG TPA: hypothetical protein ENJ05_11095 [Thiotrichales bacterium]|nr:hypothetical protein [Thiotrichales bacterium]
MTGSAGNPGKIRTGTALTLRLILGLSLLLGGCSLLARMGLDARHGSPDPANREAIASGTVDYWNDAKPILDRRCVVCHGCYDAPCQLKLGTYEGIERGATPEQVYNAARLVAAPTTRLFEDAHSTAEWRHMGFHPVLNERAQTEDANIEGSLLARMLLLKMQHPLPEEGPITAPFDFSLNRKQECPTIEEFDGFARKHPDWGMPYGLPGLSDAEYGTLLQWLREGAPRGTPPPPPDLSAEIRRWEDFLNGDSPKRQLMSRYLYEHLFLAHLYFSDGPPRTFFRLVRSATPPGTPVQRISTRRPYDDPGVERVYYRLVPVRSTILAKTHMPYALDDARMARFRELFLAPDYEVVRLPSYEPRLAANPFAVFAPIPLDSRYRFLLDEAQFFIMGFIKGPVCRGQVALNVIDDHFWVAFDNPDSPALEGAEDFLARETDKLRLPSEQSSNALALSTWIRYSALEEDYLAAKIEFARRNLDRPEMVNLDLIWDGDGHNANAALTVFRHFDSASVVKGFVGDPPKTFWIIDYPLFERIHYLLVAGFDIYGNLGHQLNTRLYMDFLRMEGELNFVALLPARERETHWLGWYREAHPWVVDFIRNALGQFDRETGIRFHTGDTARELMSMIRNRLASVLDKSHDLDQEADPFIRRQLQRLAGVRGRPVSWLPQVALLAVETGTGEPDFYTLLHNNGMTNVAQLFGEAGRRRPEEDSLTVVPGFVGAYPNAFYTVSREALPAFVAAVTGLDGEAAYRALVDRFGIRRNDQRFWRHSDRVHDAYLRREPLTAGLLDYNRLENR